MWWSVIIAFFVAILSGLGVGSAGLLVVFLTAVEHLPQLTAQGLNLLFFIFSSGSAVCVHITRRKILTLTVLVMALFGILGAVGGMILARYASESLLRKVFGGMLVVSGILTLQKLSVKKKG